MQQSSENQPLSKRLGKWSTFAGAAYFTALFMGLATGIIKDFGDPIFFIFIQIAILYGIFSIIILLIAPESRAFTKQILLVLLTIALIGLSICGIILRA